VAPIRAVIFDLDRVLLDARPAWRYTVEEAVVMATGRRIDASPLIDEYLHRPWAHALAILLDSAEERARCEDLCARITERSGMKRLLVHEGIGMGLDAVRAGRIEMGAISRAPHAIALKQAQSTGLDRFLSVLSATPTGEPWRPAERIAHCLRFLEREPAACAFVGTDDHDLAEAETAGLRPLTAGWVRTTNRGAVPSVAQPSDLLAALAAPATSQVRPCGGAG
jgi:phosphoglycolate phosphatase-like HAD superfamily hydrolase